MRGRGNDGPTKPNQTGILSRILTTSPKLLGDQQAEPAPRKSSGSQGISARRGSPRQQRETGGGNEATRGKQPRPAQRVSPKRTASRENAHAQVRKVDCPNRKVEIPAPAPAPTPVDSLSPLPECISVTDGGKSEAGNEVLANCKSTCQEVAAGPKTADDASTEASVAQASTDMFSTGVLVSAAEIDSKEEQLGKESVQMKIPSPLEIDENVAKTSACAMPSPARSGRGRASSGGSACEKEWEPAAPSPRCRSFPPPLSKTPLATGSDKDGASKKPRTVIIPSPEMAVSRPGASIEDVAAGPLVPNVAPQRGRSPPGARQVGTPVVSPVRMVGSTSGACNVDSRSVAVSNHEDGMRSWVEAPVRDFSPASLVVSPIRMIGSSSGACNVDSRGVAVSNHEDGMRSWVDPAALAFSPVALSTANYSASAALSENAMLREELVVVSRQRDEISSAHSLVLAELGAVRAEVASAVAEVDAIRAEAVETASRVAAAEARAEAAEARAQAAEAHADALDVVEFDRKGLAESARASEARALAAEARLEVADAARVLAEKRAKAAETACAVAEARADAAEYTRKSLSAQVEAAEDRGYCFEAALRRAVAEREAIEEEHCAVLLAIQQQTLAVDGEHERPHDRALVAASSECRHLSEPLEAMMPSEKTASTESDALKTYYSTNLKETCLYVDAYSSADGEGMPQSPPSSRQASSRGDAKLPQEAMFPQTAWSGREQTPRQRTTSGSPSSITTPHSMVLIQDEVPSSIVSASSGSPRKLKDFLPEEGALPDGIPALQSTGKTEKKRSPSLVYGLPARTSWCNFGLSPLDKIRRS